LGRQSAKVSGHLHEYSRFAETNAGDRVRSALRGPPGSRFDRLLEPFVREIGNFHGALRDDRTRSSNSAPALIAQKLNQLAGASRFV